MKIALIGDIHANLPALEAVLKHAREHGAEDFWNVGDAVGYGPFPDEVIQRLRQEQVTGVIGNYDLKVIHFPKKQKKFRKHKRPEKFIAFQWAYENLSPKSRTYLASLPEQIWLEVEGKQILLVHASLENNAELLVPDTPDARLEGLVKMASSQNPHYPGTDIIIFGHSHQPFTRQVGGVLFINTGSVGRPGDGDPRASYTLLEIKNSLIALEHFRLEYDVGAAVSAIREKGLPEAFAQMLIQGRDLDSV